MHHNIFASLRIDRKWRPLVKDDFLIPKLRLKILDGSRFNCDIRNQKRLLKTHTELFFL